MSSEILLASAGAIALSLSGTSSAPADLKTRANQTLGLADSEIGEVLVTGNLGQPLQVAVDLDAPVFLDLQPSNVRADSFEARAQLEDGSWVTLPYEAPRTYVGTVLGDAGSRVAASLLDDGFHARIVASSGQEFWIEPLAARFDDAQVNEHIFYRTDDVLDQGKTCAANATGVRTPLNAPNGLTVDGPGIQEMSSVTAEIACDADFEYFSTHGAGTQARIESVINTINLQYSSEVGISHMITAVLIRTSSNDPYTKKPADQLLVELRNEWNSNQTSVQRDVVHLFTGRALAGSTIGIAYVGVVCNVGVAYGLVESDFNNNFACVTDLSAHELGHNWGASHCSCSTYTMNASITCANRFNPANTIPTITNYRDSQSCFGGIATTGTVDGQVTSTADGSPIAGATVQVDTGQSATTAGDGTYSIGGVPTGNRTVTASAPGFDASNANTTVSENQTSIVNLALDPAPVGSQVVVDCITYSSTGGKGGDRNLFIEVSVVDDQGAPVSGATVSASVNLDGAAFGTASAATDASGTVTFQAKNSPNGCFETDITSIAAPGLSFDGTEPANGFSKGSDTSPDPDCRSGSDACGAG